MHVQKRGRELRLPRQHEQSRLKHVPSPRYFCWGVALPLTHSRLFCSRTDRGARHQGNIFSKDKVQHITRMSTSIIEPAVTRAGRHLPAPPGDVMGEKGDAQGLCAALPLGEGAHAVASLSAKSTS